MQFGFKQEIRDKVVNYFNCFQLAVLSVHAINFQKNYLESNGMKETHP